MTTSPPRLALVGDRSPAVRAHGRIPDLVAAASIGAGGPIELYWLASEAIERADDLDGFDGVWVVPGSPYANPDGVLAAITAARTRYVPFLGTCGGFQHGLIEFARNVCDMAQVDSAETNPDSADALIAPLRCALFGEEATVTIEPRTLAAALVGAGPSTERFFCRFGLDERYLPVLEEHGLVVSGRDSGGEVRVVELPSHPFFVASLFQPELSSDATWVHPLIAGFLQAVRQHAASVATPAVVSGARES